MRTAASHSRRSDQLWRAAARHPSASHHARIDRFSISFAGRSISTSLSPLTSPPCEINETVAALAVYRPPSEVELPVANGGADVEFPVDLGGIRLHELNRFMSHLDPDMPFGHR